MKWGVEGGEEAGEKGRGDADAGAGDGEDSCDECRRGEEAESGPGGADYLEAAHAMEVESPRAPAVLPHGTTCRLAGGYRGSHGQGGYAGAEDGGRQQAGAPSATQVVPLLVSQTQKGAGDPLLLRM